MAESSQTTQDVAGVTRTPTGTIVDQNTSIPPTSAPPVTEAPKAPETTAPSSETTKPPETKEAKDGKSTQSLVNEKSTESGAPDKYEDFKGPEGFTIDGEVAKEIGATFKDLNLSQTQAQSLVDLFVKYNRESADHQYNAYMDKRQEWRDQISSNPEIGGSKWNSTKASIGKLIDSFGKYADGFREAMDYTGAGDHPAVVGALYTLSKLLTEGGAVRGNGPSTVGQSDKVAGPPSAAQAMYPHLTSNR